MTRRGLILVVCDDVEAVEGLRRILDDGRYELVAVAGEPTSSSSTRRSEPIRSRSSTNCIATARAATCRSSSSRAETTSTPACARWRWATT
jgi:hypothetical protein